MQNENTIFISLTSKEKRLARKARQQEAMAQHIKEIEALRAKNRDLKNRVNYLLAKIKSLESGAT